MKIHRFLQGEMGHELAMSLEISAILSNPPLFPRRLLSNQGNKLPICRLVPLIEEVHAQQLVGGVEAAAVPGDFDGIGYRRLPKALIWASGGILRKNRERYEADNRAVVIRR